MVTNTKSSFIKLENVNIGYSKKNFLFENLNFVIPEKAFINIQGANGSGKTSLAKLFLGLLSPLNGKIFFNYKNPAYVPQHSNFDKQFPLNLNDIVEQGLKAKFLETIFLYKIFNHNKQIKENVDNIILKLGLNEKSNLTIDKASGGQLQRALIARALVLNPDFLVLDEPFNHLDQKSRVVVWGLLQKIYKENNITICIIDHNLFDFKNTSDVKKNIKKKLNSIYTHLINIDDKISFVKLR